MADLTIGATLYEAKNLSLNARVNLQAGAHDTGVAVMAQVRKAF